MQTPSFSTIASAGISLANKKSQLPGKDEFPALGGGSSKQSREEILLSGLLGKRGSQAQGSMLGMGALQAGNMSFSESSGTSNLSFSGPSKHNTTTLHQENLSANLAGGSLPFTAGSNQSNPASLNPNDKWGMMGLIDVIKITDPDSSTLSLGVDLTTLGLGLNGQQSIHGLFMTPFSSDTCLSSGEEGSPNLPACYTSLPTKGQSPLVRMRSMQEDTLFYIFYSMPRDVMQEGAAQELYSRGWRFHKEFKLWLVKDPSHVPNSTAQPESSDYERGVYIFFDPSTFSRVKLERVVYFDHLLQLVHVEKLDERRI